MDKIKDPTMMMSTASLICALGSGLYFYKQLEAIKAELVNLNRDVRMLKDDSKIYKKSSQTTNGNIDATVKRLKKLEKSIEHLPDIKEILELDDDIEEIVTALNQNKISVSRVKEKRVRSGDRKYQSVVSGFGTREGEYYKSSQRKSYRKNESSDEEDFNDEALIAAVKRGR